MAQKKKKPPVTAVPETKPAAPAPRTTSNGVFVDSSKAEHRWQITDSHALMWDGAPYLPIGGTFTPKSFADSTDAAWQADVAALATLKTKGLQDLIVWPGKPLTDVPVAAMQKFLDYLDASGFRYGLAFGPGLTAPLTGTIVKPATYRISDTKENLTAAWQVPNADSGLFILVDTGENNKIVTRRSGQVTARDGVITAPTDVPEASGNIVAILYPHKALPVTGNGELPDLWTGFDSYRDALLTYMGGVKLGKGFRFFLDPLTRHIGITGECDYLVPDSPGFLIEWEGFITRKYPNPEEAKLAWALSEGDYKTHESLAHLVPLWSNRRGVDYFYDGAARKTVRIMSSDQSHWWDDFLQFRDESIQYYLNAMANVLKRQVSDVPVVVTWTQSHPIFCNTDAQGGFDGLGIVANARGTALVSRAAGPAYSAAEQSARTIWSIATEVIGEPESAPRAAPDPKTTTVVLTSPQHATTALLGGYSTRSSLFTDLDWLRRVGVKGIFAGSLQSDADGRSRKTADWMSSPESLDWLHEYGAQFDKGIQAARYTPRILFFPLSAPGPARIGPIPGAASVLWMDSFAPGEVLDYWPSYRGYSILEGEKWTTVLVSLQGTRKTHLFTPNPRAVMAHLPDGTPVPVKPLDQSSVEVTIGETPVVFNMNSSALIPIEAASDALVQLSAIVDMATLHKVQTVSSETYSLEQARYFFRQKDYSGAYNFARSSLDKMIQDAQPYIWVEGESALVNTFSEVATNVEASSGGFLRLSTPFAPSRLGYAARYLFDVPEDGIYNIWLAGTPPGPNTSPIKWRINSDPPQDPAAPTPVGPLYLSERFGWFLLGSAELKKGPNRALTIYVSDKAAASQTYVFSIDALLLTTHQFTPNGTVRPLPMDAPAIRTFMRDRKIGSP